MTAVPSHRVLVVDDDRSSCEMLEEGLRLRGFDVVWRTTVDAAIRALDDDGSFDVVLTDLRMPPRSGLEIVDWVRENEADLPVIVVTAFGGIATAVDAVRRGAYDFLTKPFDLEVISLALERATQHHRLRGEVTRLRREVRDSGRYEEMIGRSHTMTRLFDVIERVAELDSTVLITGESGTGKELVARALHRRSGRAKGPFVAVNCASIPENLLESELFGHARGAFTDAKTDRTGLLARASGGTLLLDEIGDMAIGMQAKLLRAVQERRVRPVGGDKEIPFDARIIAATHRDLELLVADGRFRRDLLFRLQVIEVSVPPLRVRGSDVVELAQRFAEHFAVRIGRPTPLLQSATVDALLRYSFPGNVRELQNCMERAVALARDSEIRPSDLPARVTAVQTPSEAPGQGDSSEFLTLEALEREHIDRVLRAVHGNKRLAAEMLGVDRSTLYRKLERSALGDDRSD